MLNSLKTCIKTPPSYCFIRLRKLELEKVCLSASEILRVFVNTLYADDKYSLGNRKNLSQPIQLHLSKKQKIFCRF